MNRKLKTALQKRSSDQGFALPVAVGMGLIMILVGTTMILRSQDDQVTASVQKATARGLGVAETGITRYQSLINNNRAIATYPRTGTPSWTNAASIPGINAACNSGGAAEVITFATTDWRNVDLSDPAKGQYRLIDYIYPAPGTTGTVGVAPGTGQLTVQGRVNQSSSASTATSQLQVNIPVRAGDTTGLPVPGAWIGTGGIGGNTIQGNVLLNDCRAALSTVNVVGTDPITGQPYTKQHTSLSFPPLPAKPIFASNQVLGVVNGSRMAALGAQSITGGSDRLTLPRIYGVNGYTGASDTANGGVYEYSVSSINIPNNSELVITPGKKVKLYLDGGIATGGNIVHNCGTFTSEDLNSNGLLDSGEDKNGNGLLDTCNPTDLQIFGYGPTGTQICMSGNNYIEAFIFAPAYTVGVAGSGGGAGGIKGAVWVYSWSNSAGCGSNTSNIVAVQTASWTSLGLTPQNLPPRLSSINSWRHQEATAP